MKACAWLAAIILAVFVRPTNALGSEAWPLHVHQPFDLPNGLVLSPVTYVGYYSASQVVEMTCWPNRVWHPQDSTAHQENAALTSGMRASTDWDAGDAPTPRDTVTAVLDVNRLPFFHSENGWKDIAILAATVECLRANVGQFASRVRFLRVEIDGPAKYAGYGGVFDLTGYNCGPKVLEFH